MLPQSKGGSEGPRPQERDTLTRVNRDETRTAYILQAVEGAWEGVDRRKATDAKDPPAAEDPNGVIALAEPVEGPSSHLENSEEDEVCVRSGVFTGFPCPFREISPPTLLPLSEKRVSFGIDSLELPVESPASYFSCQNPSFSPLK